MVKAAFELSARPFRAPEIAETRRALADYDMPVAPVEITDRRAFSRAIASGRAVTEFEADGEGRRGNPNPVEMDKTRIGPKPREQLHCRLSPKSPLRNLRRRQPRSRERYQHHRAEECAP
jgi:hypothetical protein